MKNKIKKLITILVISLGVFITQVKAEVFTKGIKNGSWIPVYLIKQQPGKDGLYLQGRFILDSNGDFLYCLQPFVDFDPARVGEYDVKEEDYLSVLSLSESDWERINLLAYFGYGYSGHSDSKWYTITQVLIWKIVDPNATFYYTNTLNGVRNDNLYVEETKELNKLVDDYLVKPSFDIPSSLNLGESVSLEDHNKTLHNYTITGKNNVDANIIENNLAITSTGVGSARVTLERNITESLIPPVIYFKEGIQDIFRYGKIAPLKVEVNLNSTGGGLNIHKKDNKGNSLEGVKFGVFNEEDTQVCTIVTDSGGNGNCDDLPLGTYTVKELETIEGYVKNDTVYRVEITSDTPSVSLEIENKKITGFIEIYKIDKENNSAITQGDAKLKGAVYGIYDANGKKVDELVTDEYGYDRSIELEYGKYTIKELQPSEGYIIDDTVYNANINEDGIVIKTTSKEQVIKFDFKMLKVESDGRSGVIEAEPNAVFNIFLKSKNALVGTITTDNEGKAKITLPYGVYNVCQIKGSDEAGITPCFEININTGDVSKIVNNGLVNARLKVIKVDQDNKVIPLAGIKFKIKDLSTNEYVCQTVSYPNKVTYCEFETNAEGILITPFPLDAGDYELEEVDQYIEGYLWNSKPLKFSIKTNTSYLYDEELGVIIEVRFNNTEVKGVIEVYKLGEKVVIQNGKFTYEEIPLANVHFGLYDELGNFIKEYITDDNGYLKIEDLKLGKYILKEIATDGKHVLDETELIVELVYKDQYTPVITKTFNLKNYLKKGNLEFSKTDVSTGKEIPNVKIEIYTENDELIFEGITNKDGKIILENLFVGKFYIVETEAAMGYLLCDKKVYFEIKENGEIVKANMTNEKIKGDLEFTKEDLSTGEVLPNTLIEVYKNDTDELIFSGRTDEEGKIVIKGLEYGRYYILEKEASEGYVINEEKMYFEIRENGKVIKLEMKNEKIKGVVKLLKVDNHDKKIKGVKYELFDINNNSLGIYETNENGFIEIELEYGSYYFKEIDTLEHLVLNGDKIFFSIKNNNELIELKVINDIIKSKIKLHKVDEEGNPLIGVKFDLYDKEDNYLGTYETDNEGDIELELEYGVYYFIEKEAIPTYELNSDKQYFEVTKDGEVIELSVVNIKVPDTLVSIDYNIILGGILLVLKKKYCHN